MCITSQASAGLLPKFRFGVKAGFDYQSNDIKNDIKNLDIKSNSGWFAGVQGDLSWGNIGVRPEVIYSHNKFNVDGAEIADKFKDAFIVAFLDGKKTDTRQAIELFKKQTK